MGNSVFHRHHVKSVHAVSVCTSPLSRPRDEGLSWSDMLQPDHFYSNISHGHAWLRRVLPVPAILLDVLAPRLCYAQIHFAVSSSSRSMSAGDRSPPVIIQGSQPYANAFRLIVMTFARRLTTIIMR